MPRLTGKTAIITGAARGIGAAIAQALVAEGAFALLTDLNEPLLRETTASLGNKADCIVHDVRDETGWPHVMDQLMQRHGRIDVMVNNAGITGFENGIAPHDPEHATLEAWRSVHAVNLDGVFLGCKHAIVAMRQSIETMRNAKSSASHIGGGSIINIGSRSGVVGIPGAAAYASSKAAVRNHTKSVALYCAEQGLNIRCNVIQPAAILTPMWEPMLGNGPDRAARMAAFTRDTPLARFGTPQEVAALAVYLASDESAYTTGAEFNIDGGILAGTIAPRPSAE